MAFSLLTLTACDQSSVPVSIILTEKPGEITTAEETAFTEIAETTSASDDAETGNSPNAKSEVRVVLVGDSRAYNLATMVCGSEKNDSGVIVGPMGSDYVICAGGKGFDWMLAHEGDIDGQAAENTAIVIGMGVNGCEPRKGEGLDQFAERYSSMYADWINKKAEYWASKGAKTYFCSINPINDEKAEKRGFGIKDEYVCRVNEAVKTKLNGNAGYIDTYSQVYDILASGKGSDDGLHYHGYVYEIIRDYIWQAVNDR